MQATSTATATRVNLGPLTTTFSPPGDCTSLRFINENVVFMGAAIGYGCYEVQWSSAPCTTYSGILPSLPPTYGTFTCPTTRIVTGERFGTIIDWLCQPSQTGTQRASFCAVKSTSANRDFSLTQSCYPPKFASSFKPTSYDTGKWSSHPPIYSPGLACPSGYLPTCTVERIKGSTNSAATATNANNVIWSMLNEGEIAIGCCPS